MLFYDTETCGFHGPIVLIQYKEQNGPVKIQDVWLRPVKETLELIEWMMTQDLVGFNLTFDHFHLCQLYTTLLNVQNKDEAPFVNEVANLEGISRLGPCLKPKGCLDLMLHARKGPYQTLMDRKNVRVRRVPAPLAKPLAQHLNESIPISDVYFARKADSTQHWIVRDSGDSDPEFRDVVLEFAPNSGLKSLIADITGHKGIALEEIYPTSPREHGYAPFAKAPIWIKNKVFTPDETCWYKKWPTVILEHVIQWRDNPLARKYAKDDPIYTEKLFDHFGQPAMNDIDSILACMVGAVRWRGFAIDSDKVVSLRNKTKARAVQVRQDLGFNYQSSQACLENLKVKLSEVEQQALFVNDKVSTSSNVLIRLGLWEDAEVCDDCYGSGCDACDEGFVGSGTPHPVAETANLILEGRSAKNKINTLNKILSAGRFHASFAVIGTLSGRMSGSGGDLNAQGIEHSKATRECFTLADNGLYLQGGDFDAFEISIADAVYADPTMHAELASGKKFHGMLGQHLFQTTYDAVLASKDLEGPKNLYARSKNGTFALLYGGSPHTLVTRVAIPENIAEEAFNSFGLRYPVWRERREVLSRKFCTMEHASRGSRIKWSEPHEYIESMFGFKRYFTIENQVVKALFEMAQAVPAEWKKLPLQVYRKEKEQSAAGAVSSALFGAAFGLQAANFRAAANHEIQSPGATITKELQGRLWSNQPVGINDWAVVPLNVHDEVMCPTSLDLTGEVNSLIEDMKKHIPLIAMKWQNVDNWAGKE